MGWIWFFPIFIVYVFFFRLMIIYSYCFVGRPICSNVRKKSVKIYEDFFSFSLNQSCGYKFNAFVVFLIFVLVLTSIGRLFIVWSMHINFLDTSTHKRPPKSDYGITWNRYSACVGVSTADVIQVGERNIRAPSTTSQM